MQQQPVLTMEHLESMEAQIKAHKAFLASKEESQSIFDASKERFVSKNQQEWREIGQRFKEVRLFHGLSQEYIASCIGVSPSKVSNFENGKPIVHANLMRNAYSMFFVVHRGLCEVHDIEGYTENIIDNIETLMEDHSTEESPVIHKAVKGLCDYLLDIQIRLWESNQSKPKQARRKQGIIRH